MLLFLDGQAHYDGSQLGLKYSSVTSDFATWSVVPEGRTGNAIKRIATSNASTDPRARLAIAPLMTRTGVWVPTTSGVCGFAFKVDQLSKVDIPSRTSEADLFAVMENVSAHVKVALTPDGTFILRGRELNGIGGEILLAQTAEGIQSNTWSYLEFKWVINETAGNFQLRVNGVELLNFTGNTHQQWITPTPVFQGVWTSVRLLGLSSRAGSAPLLTAWLSDLYLADLTTPDPDDVHDFLGDGRVQTILPDGVGSSTGWTPAGVAQNWDATNDRPTHDGDTTYVVTAAPGTQDTYNFENVPGGAQVKGVQLSLLARKEDDGGAMIAPVARQAGVDYLGPAQGVASLVYDRYLTQPYDSNPATGATWTATEVNAGEWGLKKLT